MQRATIYLAIILLVVPLFTRAQRVVNASFEGTAGIARTPDGWLPYGIASSPDTQPGAWSVFAAPSHGTSYLSMVCRGESIINSNLWELCYTQLESPLKPGESYKYSIDLARSPTFVSSGITFYNPVNLRIWGMNKTMMNEELLWESGAVTKTTWKTHKFTVSPKHRVDYFVLEAYYVSMPKYCGNILIDNIVYYPEEKLIIRDTTDDGGYNFVFNEFELPEKINGRPVKESGIAKFKSDKLVIKVWDNRTFDGDTISLFLNGKCILSNFGLSKQKKIIKLDMQPNTVYYLILFAHNLGSIPPNTAAMIIDDGRDERYITLKSDLDNCGALKIEIGDVEGQGRAEQ